MKKTVNALARGEVFTYAGRRWIVLAHEGSRTLCLSKDVVCEKAFDEGDNNDFSKSSIYRWLNGLFLDSLTAAGGSSGAFVPCEVDLTADNCIHSYGVCGATIFLLTADQYRANRNIIPATGEWWWLSSPHNTAAEGFSLYAHFIGVNGALMRAYARHDYVGIRPACYLRSDTLVDTGAQAESHAPEVSEFERSAYSDILRDCLKNEPFDPAPKAEEKPKAKPQGYIEDIFAAASEQEEEAEQTREQMIAALSFAAGMLWATIFGRAKQ